MSEELNPGDRAIVIREHCNTAPLGLVVTIGPRTLGEKGFCSMCGATVHLPMVNVVDEKGDGFWPRAWLKKLPPLSELEGEKCDEEITA